MKVVEVKLMWLKESLMMMLMNVVNDEWRVSTEPKVEG